MIFNNKRFPSLNVIKYKTSPYGSKGVLRNYNYCSDPKLVLRIVVIRKIHAITMLEQLYYLFLGIQTSKKQLISLDMVEFIIENTLKILVVTIT